MKWNMDELFLFLLNMFMKNGFMYQYCYLVGWLGEMV